MEPEGARGNRFRTWKGSLFLTDTEVLTRMGSNFQQKVKIRSQFAKTPAWEK